MRIDIQLFYMDVISYPYPDPDAIWLISASKMAPVCKAMHRWLVCTKHFMTQISMASPDCVVNCSDMIMTEVHIARYNVRGRLLGDI